MSRRPSPSGPPTRDRRKSTSSQPLTSGNKLASTAKFDDAEQVVLANAKSEYAEDRQASEALSDSFVRADPIQPNGRLVGRVVFRTSRSFASRLTTPGVNFTVANFNDAGRIDEAKRLGTIRVWK